MPAAARSTKEQILLTAERMIADHGVDGVSMRQIGTEVGSGNNSVVLYHFAPDVAPGGFLPRLLWS